VLFIFVSHRSSAFLRVIRLIDFVTQLTAVLHAGSLVSCQMVAGPRYIAKARTTQKTPLPLLCVAAIT
jgi:hypothetical protein